MEKLLIVSASVALLALVALFVMGQMSQSGAARGLVDGRLAPCPDAPNCVSSEVATDDSHFIEPLTYSDAAAEQVINRLKDVIHNMGGEIEVGWILAKRTPYRYFFRAICFNHGTNHQPRRRSPCQLKTRQ